MSNPLHWVTLWKEARWNYAVLGRIKSIRVGIFGWQQFLNTALQKNALCILKLSYNFHRRPWWLFLSIFIICDHWTRLPAEYVWILSHRRVLAHFAFEHTFSALNLALVIYHSEHIWRFNHNIVFVAMPLALAVTVCLFNRLLFVTSSQMTWNG